MAAALHEAGYGFVQAFGLGFQGGGGSVLATAVTHRKSADEDPAGDLRALVAHNPDFVMGFYAGREGVSFINAWSALGFHGVLPLLSTPLMTHDQWLPSMGTGALGVRTAFSWDPAGFPSEHERFRRAAGILADREPAVFALLGYETGRLLVEAVRRHGGPCGGDDLRDALSGLSCPSPRGELRLDAETGEVVTVDYVQEIVAGADGACKRVTLGLLDLPESFRAHYKIVRDQESRSGWINPYLVT